MSDPTAEVVTLCQELLRFDTTNTGDPDTSRPERPAAEYVAARLAEVGLDDATLTESHPGRTSVVVRVPGADRERGALLVHGHLDVVPAEPDDWSVPPFAGEVHDGYLWGRGAVDMKDVDAMVLAVVRHWQRTGYRPPRDLVLAFTADEEAGGLLGAHHLVDTHPELLRDCTEAVGEVGGYSHTLRDDLRLYPVQVAEKGLDWLRLTTTGTPGHGSMRHDDNAVTALTEAMARLGRHEFPVEVTPPVRAFLTEVARLRGVAYDPDAGHESDPTAVIDTLGPLARLVWATVRNTANPTRLAAGYKENVVPGRAWGTVDCRTLPGHAEPFLDTVRALVGPEVAVEHLVHQPPVQTTFDGPLADAMAAALRAEDPGAHPVPYMLSGGTDAKAFARLGMRCFGFSPLRLPPDLDFTALFHGVDERVPVDALAFGVRVLDRFLRAA